MSDYSTNDQLRERFDVDPAAVARERAALEARQTAYDERADAVRMRLGSSIQEIPSAVWLDTPLAVRDAVERRVTRRGVCAQAMCDEGRYIGTVEGQGIAVEADTFPRLVERVYREARRIAGLTDGEELPVFVEWATTAVQEDLIQAYIYSAEAILED
jgi:hypothetical protein